MYLMDIANCFYVYFTKCKLDEYKLNNSLLTIKILLCINIINKFKKCITNFVNFTVGIACVI